MRDLRTIAKTPRKRIDSGARTRGWKTKSRVLMTEPGNNDQISTETPLRNAVVVIMAGGAGTRFWPASTEERPKQFLPFFGARSLLQQSYDRVAGLLSDDRILVLTQERFRPLVEEQLPNLPPENIIGEPMRRDTAAAIALAALLSKKRFDNPVMAVLTSDQLIEPVEAFQTGLRSAMAGALNSNALYTFGITPTFPATGYGYLELGPQLENEEPVPHYALKRFVEKPNLEKATAYLQSSSFLWNSGMFVWQNRSILAEFERQMPDHLRVLGPAVETDGETGFADALREAFLPLPKQSVDFGILENAKEVRCVRSSFAWSDVGGFLALGEHLPQDEKQNARRGEVFALDAAQNLVFAEDEGETIALFGVSDLLVVRSGKKTLIAPKSRAEELKKLVEILPERLK